MSASLIDLPMMEHVGLSIAVADANPQLCEHVDWVTEKGGGCGAVREVVDDLVSARDAWDEIIEDYRSRFGAGVAVAMGFGAGVAFAIGLGAGVAFAMGFGVASAFGAGSGSAASA